MYRIYFKFSPQELEYILSPTRHHTAAVKFREADGSADGRGQILQVMFLANFLSSFIIIIVVVVASAIVVVIIIIFNWL